MLSHFQEPIFSRHIMTRSLGYQKEVFNVNEVLNYFSMSNFEDCRVNAYPSFTKYGSINRTPASFLMIDIDLKDFASKDKLDLAMNRIVKKLKQVYMAILLYYGPAMGTTFISQWKALS
jgi:hypothetical protein